MSVYAAKKVDKCLATILFYPAEEQLTVGHDSKVTKWVIRGVVFSHMFQQRVDVWCRLQLLIRSAADIPTPAASLSLLGFTVEWGKLTCSRTSDGG